MFCLGVKEKAMSVVSIITIITFMLPGRKILVCGYYDYEKWGLQLAIALSILLATLLAGYFLSAWRKKVKRCYELSGSNPFFTKVLG